MAAPSRWAQSGVCACCSCTRGALGQQLAGPAELSAWCEALMPGLTHVAVAAACRVLLDLLYIGTFLLCSCNTCPLPPPNRDSAAYRNHDLTVCTLTSGMMVSWRSRHIARSAGNVPAAGSCCPCLRAVGRVHASAQPRACTVCMQVLHSPGLPSTLALPLPARHLQHCRPSSEPQVDFSLSCASLSIDEGRNSKVGPACAAAGCPALVSLPSTWRPAHLQQRCNSGHRHPPRPTERASQLRRCCMARCRCQSAAARWPSG